mgnify:CR=1 FL=1
MMLVGSFNHKLDVKGRTVLPAKFRGELGSSVVATIGIDHCSALYPVPRWEELLIKLKDLSSFKKKTRDFRRVLLAMASEQEIDAEDHIEMWDTAKGEEHRGEVLADFSELAEDLEDI